MNKTPAAQRYTRRSWVVVLLYIMVASANAAMPHVFSPPRMLVVTMALVLGLLVVALIVLLAMYLQEETDEYVRNRSILAMLLATGVVLVLSSVLGMLQIGGLIGHVPMFLAFVVWSCAWGIARVWLEWRDRREEVAP